MHRKDAQRILEFAMETADALIRIRDAHNRLHDRVGQLEAKKEHNAMDELEKLLRDMRQSLDRIDARLDMIESRGEVEADLAELIRRDSLDDAITTPTVDV